MIRVLPHLPACSLPGLCKLKLITLVAVTFGDQFFDELSIELSNFLVLQ